MCWGALNDPRYCDFKYEHMTDWGRKAFGGPGVIVDGKLITNDPGEDFDLGIRILLGSSYYQSWENEPMFVERDALGNPVDRNHPWNQSTIPRPQKRDFDEEVQATMSPRWFDGTDHLAYATPAAVDRPLCGPPARLGGLVDFG